MTGAKPCRLFSFVTLSLFSFCFRIAGTGQLNFWYSGLAVDARFPLTRNKTCCFFSPSFLSTWRWFQRFSFLFFIYSFFPFLSRIGIYAGCCWFAVILDLFFTKLFFPSDNWREGWQWSVIGWSCVRKKMSEYVIGWRDTITAMMISKRKKFLGIGTFILFLSFLLIPRTIGRNNFNFESLLFW